MAAEVEPRCSKVLEMPYLMDSAANDHIVTMHVCGLATGHDHPDQLLEQRRHRCRKHDCHMWWFEMAENPFAKEDPD